MHKSDKTMYGMMTCWGLVFCRHYSSRRATATALPCPICL